MPQGPLPRASSSARIPDRRHPLHPFALPPVAAAKADPSLIAGDARRLEEIATALESDVALLETRLAEERRRPAGFGQNAVERDQEVHRLTARLRTLRRYGADLCLGRFVTTDGACVYVGRLGLTALSGERLLVDWRSPAAEPFFAATPAHPLGVAWRRRYRWAAGRIVDYWDEPIGRDDAVEGSALDQDAAFLASLGASRSARMRDVLATLQADQDAAMRADSRGALVVEGGPGTGKTVVALHRAAYLSYSDARLAAQGGGVLVVGPHRPYLDYVADVLPSLGEDSVRTCTMRDLVPEGDTAAPEADEAVARLKATLDLAIDAAVAMYEEPPADGLTLEVGEDQVRVTPAHWAEAFDAPEPGTPHNEAREVAWRSLVGLAARQLRDDDEPEEEPDEFDAYDLAQEPPGAMLRRVIAGNRELRRAFNAAWPLLDPLDVVGDLLTVSAYLRRSAPWLTPAEAAMLQRDRPDAWTVADLPLIDAARHRLGDFDPAVRARRERALAVEERDRRADVVADLMAHDDSELRVMSMLRGQDLRGVLASTDAPQGGTSLEGPFAHVIVDEAQELTDAEWRGILRRCPSGSVTVVGDRAQARRGFSETWEERLARVGMRDIRRSALTLNYRTPREIMEAAAPEILAAMPDAQVPTSIRSSGVAVRRDRVDRLRAILDSWLAGNADGIACVIGAPDLADAPRVRSLTPALAKGLEFDLVVVVRPGDLGTGIAGAVDRYVAMSRATRELVVLA